MSWLLVTPARNEADRLPQLVASLKRQLGADIARWVIVDDGSTDGTADVIDPSEFPFPVEVIAGPNLGGLAKGSAFASFLRGADHGLAAEPTVERVMKLDADVRLNNRYFAACDEATAGAHDIGLVGGVAVGRADVEQTDLVPGFVKGYSRAGFEVVRRLPAAIGLDVVDQQALTLAGLRTVVVPTAHVRLTRSIGHSEGLVRGRQRNGRVSRWVGYHPVYFLLRVVRYVFRPPVVVSAVALVIGYVTAGPGPYDPSLKREMRRVQSQKLRELVRRPVGFLRASYAQEKCDDPACCGA